MTKAEEDLKAYNELIASSDCDRAFRIEQRYGLDGYPPSIVSGALSAIVRGEDMYEWIDNNITQ